MERQNSHAQDKKIHLTHIQCKRNSEMAITNQNTNMGGEENGHRLGDVL